MGKKIKAVLLCAGVGSRLAPLTVNLPKALVEVKSKPLIEYKLDILKDLVDEVVIVVGYLGEKIKQRYGNNYNRLKLVYVEQKELLGTGHALICAKEHLNKNDKLLVLNGDDIYFKEDIEKLLSSNFAVLGYEVKNPQNFGVLILDEKNNLTDIIEKPKEFISNMANIGCYVFNYSIFDYELKLSSRKEYEIVDYLKHLIEKGKKIKVEKAKGWLPVNNFKELEIANNYKF